MNIKAQRLERSKRTPRWKRWILRNYLNFWLIGVLVVILMVGLVTTAFASNAAISTEKPLTDIKTRQVRVITTTTSTTTVVTTTTTAPPVTTAPVAPTTAPPAPMASQVEPGTIQAMIVESAQRHGLDPDRMLRIAKCESGFNPNAINRNYYAGGGNPAGLYQFLPETWNRYSSRAGYSGSSVFDASANVEVTMYAFSSGGAGEWACK